MRCLRTGRLLSAVIAAAVAGVVIGMSPSTASATSVSASGQVCPSSTTWSFSAPLTLGFTPSGTVTQSWVVASVCAGNSVSANPDEVDIAGEASLQPKTVVEPYTGSCIVASVGLGFFGLSGEQGVLVGGSVLVAPPYNPGNGTDYTEFDVLDPNSVCNETSASGTGFDADASASVQP